MARGSSIMPLVVGALALSALAPPGIIAATCPKENMRVAIVGTGISGAAAGYLLFERVTRIQKTLPECPVELKIDYFEKNDYVGGRLLTKKLKNLDIDVGGESILQDNLYMKYFVDKLDLEDKSSEPQTPPNMVAWDGEDIVWKLQLVPSDAYETDLKKLASDYPDIKTSLYPGVVSTLKAVKNVYTLQGFESKEEKVLPGQIFADGYELLKALNLSNAVEDQTSYFESFGILKQNSAIENFVVPANRGNMNQEDMNGFAAAAVLGSTYGFGAGVEHLSVKGGNQKVVKGLIELTKAGVHMNTEVKKISRNDDGTFKLTVSFKGANDAVVAQPFDYVVIATPIETTSIALDENAKMKTQPERQFKGVHSAFVVAKGIDTKKFDTSTILEEEIFMLLTKQNADTSKTPQFNVIVLQKGIPGTSGGSALFLFKVFSDKELSDEDLGQYFVGVQKGDTDNTAQLRQHWEHAYTVLPAISAPYKFPKTVLDKGLYYSSSMETVMSSMESQCMFAANVALQIVNDHYGSTAPSPTPTSAPTIAPTSTPTAQPGSALNCNSASLVVYVVVCFASSLLFF